MQNFSKNICRGARASGKLSLNGAAVDLYSCSEYKSAAAIFIYAVLIDACRITIVHDALRALFIIQYRHLLS